MTEQRNNGGAAFPGGHMNLGDGDSQPYCMGMSLRDWFASQAPSPSAEWMSLMRNVDQARNPHNDSYKPARRSDAMLVAAWKYECADAMIAAREATQ